MDHKDNSEELRDACGVFGCVAAGDWPTNLDVAHIIYLGMIALQHRGQESCGMTISKGECVLTHKKPGLVGHAFTEEDFVKLKGNMGIGHTRYSTTGGTDHLNIQPFVVHSKHGVLAVAHNGQLVNAAELRKEIIENGVGLSTESDSELMVQILCMPPPEPNSEKNGPDWPARIKNLMRRTKTAYSLLIMNGEKIYAVRDPFGNRPLCIGKLVPPSSSLRELIQLNGDVPVQNHNGNVSSEINVEDCDGYVVSSESCAFPSVSARLLREVLPGEIVEITKHGFKSIFVMPRPESARVPAFCIFEYVYFARADSVMEGQMVYTARKECGRQLARQAPVDADVVSCVPETATAATLGFADESNIPYAQVLCKNAYVGRTFIQPSARLRKLAVLKKFGALSENFKGKRLVLVDDSIVRGTTIGAIIRLLREAGASEVHVRVASPPLRYPCYMGINIPTKEELIANKLNAEQLAHHIGADSLVYLNVDNLKSAIKKNISCNGNSVGHCTACLTGKYPIELQW